MPDTLPVTGRDWLPVFAYDQLLPLNGGASIFSVTGLRRALAVLNIPVVDQVVVDLAPRPSASLLTEQRPTRRLQQA